MGSRSRNRNDGEREYSEDDPIYSRLFVVYDKKSTKNDLEQAFSQFGVIENIKIPLDINGLPKGVCFIKFSKTSEAANALEAMHFKGMANTNRTLKVMVAVNRSEVERSDSEDPEKYKRLFLHIPRNMTENELESIFAKFGRLRSVTIQKDHHTGDSKGFGYVSYSKFSEAAKAFEECERHFRPVFAKPKIQKRVMTSFESNIGALAKSSGPKTPLSFMSMMGNECQNNYSIFTKVNYMCCPHLTHFQIGKLFDLIPGMEDCQFFIDRMRNCGKGTITYNNPISAAYAVEKLNEFEYPPGMLLFVKPDKSAFVDDRLSYNSIPKAMSKLQNAIEYSSSTGAPDLVQLAEAVAQASRIIKMATGEASEDVTPDSNDINYCSAKLPPPKPLAHIDSAVAKRCFLICKPAPPPLTVLRDIFCRFGDLINVYTLPNKTVGYARYASVQAANEAIQTLHGAEVCGVRMKVLEADEEAPPRKKRLEMDADQN